MTIARIKKSLGLNDVTEVNTFLTLAIDLLTLIANGKTTSQENHEPESMGPAWDYFKELDKDIEKTASVYSLIDKERGYVDRSRIETWRAFITSLLLIVDIDMKLRVRVDKTNIITLKPQADLAGPSLKNNDKNDNNLQGRLLFQEEELLKVDADLELQFRREHFIDSFLSLVLKKVDSLPAQTTASTTEAKASQYISRYMDFCDSLFEDWRLCDAKDRIYSDFCYACVKNGHDIIAMSCLQNIGKPNENLYQEILDIIGGRVLNWMYTRGNNEDKSLVFAKMSGELNEWIENRQPEENMPILDSCIQILDFVGMADINEDICNGLIEIVRLVVDEKLDPLAIMK